MEPAARIAVGLVLVGAAAAKLRLRAELPDLLGGYGIPPRVRGAAAVALVAAEALLGALLLSDLAAEVASYAAVALGGVFVAAVTSARLRGARRLRCGCFGARERSTAVILVRALAFTGVAGLAAFGDELRVSRPSRETAVLIALAVLSGAVVVLTLLVLALYRHVGVLSLRIGPRTALELAEEGPAVGEAAPPLGGLVRRGGELVAFFSAECRVCRELAPGVRALAREGIRVHVVYEEDDETAFRRWNVPGSPFAVHVLDGVVAAKGLVNTLEELEGVVDLGRARKRHAAA